MRGSSRSARACARHLPSGLSGVCVSLLMVASLVAQSPPNIPPRLPTVPDNQRSAEQQTIAKDFAATGMSNAGGTYLNYPALAQRLLPHLRYLFDESTLPPRHRALLALRTAWLTRSQYLWAHRAPAARRNGVTDEELTRIARGPDAAG